VRYAWIREHREEFPVALMCEKLEVSRSGYYDWTGRKPGRLAIKREKLAEAARKYYQRSHGIYGYRKVHVDITHDVPHGWRTLGGRRSCRALLVTRFELHRGHVSQGGVTPDPIVEDFDVPEKVFSGLLSGFVDLAANPL
jgi:hypothetical protein